MSDQGTNQFSNKRKSRFKVKVFDRERVVKESEQSRNQKLEFQATGGASSLFDMIVQNAQKRSGTASFKSSIERSVNKPKKN